MDENGPPSLSLFSWHTKRNHRLSLFLLFVTLAYFGLAKASRSSLKAESRNEMDQKAFSINTVLFAPFNTITLGGVVFTQLSDIYGAGWENQLCVQHLGRKLGWTNLTSSHTQTTWSPIYIHPNSTFVSEVKGRSSPMFLDQSQIRKKKKETYQQSE